MLEKLAAIANFADQQGYHEAAGDLTQLIKNAQLFDALKTLFDPSSSELDLNSGFWKRLTRGWQRGKFDRRLGLALAINAERTKLNKKIELLARPLKDFSAQVNAFYDKVKSGGENYGAMDFKTELSQLKSDASKMKNLIGGRDLRKALDMRNKLNIEQINAVEKIKGIDPEHKDFLVKLLNGEIKSTPIADETTKDKEEVPGATPTSPGFGLGNKRTPEQRAIGEWLGLQKIPSADYDEGFHGSRSQGRAAQIYQRYGYNPIAALEFFKQNPEKKREGVELFGTRFRKLFEDLNWAVELEEAKKKEEKAKIEQALEVAKETVKPVPAKEESVTPAEPVVPVEKKPVTKKPSELAADLADIRKIEKAEEEAKKRKIKKTETKPEEKTPRVVSDIPLVSPTADLAVSVATRTAREITRFGRVQQLRKLAAPAATSWEDYINLLNEKAKAEPGFGMQDKDDLGPDMYDAFPAGREQYDEEKDYDQNELMLNMMGPGGDDYEAPEEKLDYGIPTVKRKIRHLELKLLNTSPDDDVEDIQEKLRVLHNQLEVLEEY